MICFLTGSHVIPGTSALNPANRLVETLQAYFPQSCRGVYVCADPDNAQQTDFYSGLVKQNFEDAGFHFQDYIVLDGRNAALAPALVQKSNFLILSGGHVPTQNRFFQRVNLRGLLKGFDGVVFGISAGSMNSAEWVYAQPEEQGEAIDPAYQRFLPGLGLTKTNLLPHYQQVKDTVLDGLRLFQDITCADSRGRTFYAIPDGSYLFSAAGREELRGDAYRIQDGKMERIAAENDTLLL